jgi:hypothetical protein
MLSPPRYTIMAKRQKVQTTKPSAVRIFKWSDEQWTSMLAWLDHCLIRRRRKISFERTIQEHICSKWPDFKFSKSRIETKLHWIWDKRAPSGSAERCQWMEILKKCSKCLNMDFFSGPEKIAFSMARLELGLPVEFEIVQPTDATQSAMARPIEYLQSSISSSNTGAGEHSADGRKRKPIVMMSFLYSLFTR